MGEDNGRGLQSGVARCGQGIVNQHRSTYTFNNAAIIDRSFLQDILSMPLKLVYIKLARQGPEAEEGIEINVELQLTAIPCYLRLLLSTRPYWNVVQVAGFSWCSLRWC